MDGNEGGSHREHETEDTQSKGSASRGNVAAGLGGAVVGSVLGPGGAVVGGVLGASESIRETLKAVRTARDSQVMVRLNKESLSLDDRDSTKKLDDLVNCGLTNSRSEAAAFLIAEGVRARADLYDKIAEQSEIIRKAREQMSHLLDDSPETVGHRLPVRLRETVRQQPLMDADDLHPVPDQAGRIARRVPTPGSLDTGRRDEGATGERHEQDHTKEVSQHVAVTTS